MPTTTRASFKRHKKQLLLCVVGLALVAYGGSLIHSRQQATNGPATLPTADQIVIQDHKTPEEKPVSKAAYTTPPDQPKYIRIASIGVDGILQKVGLNPANAVSVPTNINFSGWFTNSVRPGDAGLSIIVGHVSGKYADGIFKNLNKLSSGETIEVVYGDDSIRKFKVTEKKTILESEAASYLFTKKPEIEKQLNLITCAGKFNNATQTYADRVIVVASRI